MSGKRLPYARVGIVGAGQLGLMLCDAARRLGIGSCVLDSDPGAPAFARADHSIVGDRFDPPSLRKLAASSDVITFEIEHADSATLAELEAAGTAVRPSATVLDTVRDKWRQRTALERAGVPGPRAYLWSDDGERPGGRSSGNVPLEPPFVQKLRFGGYDGRGVKVIRSEDGEPLAGASLVEELVDIRCEVAVLVARTPSGREIAYPPVFMEFDPAANICTRCLLPAGLEPDVAERCRSIALQAVRALGAVGICAVELFVTGDDRVLVNELAPRPHNSGHLTMEASATGQFEQHLRAILDLPLGSVETVRPAVMVNVLGGGASGASTVSGYEKLLELPEAHLHLYDKRPSKPGRKMGHITVCADRLETAVEVADRAQALFRLYGRNSDRPEADTR